MAIPPIVLSMPPVTNFPGAGASRFPPGASLYPGIIRTVTIRPVRDALSVAEAAPPRSVAGIVWDCWMVALSLASLGSIIWVEARGLTWPDPIFKRLAAIDLVIVAICAIEFAVRAWRAPDKKAFFKANWYDLPGLIPMAAESFALLRATRVFRIVRVLRLLRVVYATRRLSRSFELARKILEESKLGYSVSVFALVTCAMAGVFWLVEGDSNPQLRNFGDALWWAVSTAATVGYGDIAPTTGIGRIVAVALMMFGLGFIGVVTSSLSAAMFMVARVETTEEIMPSLSAELAALAQLREQGMLSEDELTAAKKKVLGR